MARRRAACRTRSRATRALSNQLKLQRDASQRLKAERLRNGALELETIEATPVTKDGRIVDLKRHPQEPGARSDRGFHDREQRRDREVPREPRAVGDPPRRARAGALGAHRRAGGAVRHDASRRSPTRSLSPSSSPSAARPIRSVSPICRSSIVKLMGPGIYALDLPARIPAGISVSRRTTTRTPPRPTAATPTS